MSKYFLSIAFSMVLALPVAAQVTTSAQIRDARQEILKDIRGTKQNVGQEINVARQNLKQEFERKRVESKNQIEQKKEEFQKQIEAKRAELQKRVETKRQALKTKLAKIKDENKKLIVERVDQQLDQLNELQLNHFSQVLKQLEKVLDNIDSRTDKAEANGRDVSAVRTAITGAQNAIAASRTAIQTQAGKTYTLTITTETALRQDVGKARQALHADLVKVRDTVKAARDAVHKAATTLAQIPKVDDLEVGSGLEEATTTPTSSPQ